jgi:hypothetical protein
MGCLKIISCYAFSKRPFVVVVLRYRLTVICPRRPVIEDFLTVHFLFIFLSCTKIIMFLVLFLFIGLAVCYFRTERLSRRYIGIDSAAATT